MAEEIISLRNYAHIGDAVWEVYVREYTIYKTQNAKNLHKITTDRVNAEFQKNMLELMYGELTDNEQELARRGRNLPIPIGRKSIQNTYRYATAFEVLIGYWYLHDKNRLEYFFKLFKSMEIFA